MPEDRDIGPVHLGDGAYAQLDPGGGVWLTANHHELGKATDKVYLEYGAIEELCRWYFGAKRWEKMRAAGRAQAEAGQSCEFCPAAGGPCSVCG